MTEFYTQGITDDMLEPQKVIGMGSVRLVDWIGDDERVVYAARRSYQHGTKHTSMNRALIRRLVRLRHTSPLEHVRFTFEIECEMFTFGQWVRHRMGSFSVLSFRYSQAEGHRFYVPAELRRQDLVNKQGSGKSLDEQTAAPLLEDMMQHNLDAMALYNRLIDAGVCREQARMVLPQSVYTNFVWSVDLHNLMNFLRLRLDHHAQWEIRQYAGAILNLVRPIVPECMAAFEEYLMTCANLSTSGLNMVRRIVRTLPQDEAQKHLHAAFDNVSERQEFSKLLGFEEGQ